MERKLARVEKIAWIKPIKGADNIELCGVLGWQCIISKKDNFKPGDKIIYIEIDSVLPDKPEYEFLRRVKFKISTIKLKGEISQGLVLPLPENLKDAEIGYDCTELLEIKKHVPFSKPPKKHEGVKKYIYTNSLLRGLFLKKRPNHFPYWVSKTDEERIQNIPEILEDFADETVTITEKIDYQSVTFTSAFVPRFNNIIFKILSAYTINTKFKFLFSKFDFIVCSRNLRNFDKKSLYWQIAKKYKIKDILLKNPNLTIQGEQGCSKVQGNKYEINEPTLWVFNVINGNYHYNYREMLNFCKQYDLEVVPLIDTCKLGSIGKTVNDIVEYSKGKSVIGNIPREGIVVRQISNGAKILSFKVINPDFLIKFKE